MILHSQELEAALASQSATSIEAARYRRGRARGKLLPVQPELPAKRQPAIVGAIRPGAADEGFFRAAGAMRYETEVRLLSCQHGFDEVGFECRLVVEGGQAVATYRLKGRKKVAEVVDITPDFRVRDMASFVRFRTNARRMARQILFEKEQERRRLVKAMDAANTRKAFDAARDAHRKLTGGYVPRTQWRGEAAEKANQELPPEILEGTSAMEF